MKKKHSSKFIVHYLKHITDDELVSAIQKQVTSLIENALQLSQSDQREAERSIHSIRVTLKKLRAYWRLIRFLVTDTEFKTADMRIRSTAKQLAGQRDQQVLCASLQTLTSKLKAPERIILMAFIEQVNETSNAAQKIMINWPEVVATLQLELCAWKNLTHSPSQNHLIQKALQTTFNHSRRCAKKATQKAAQCTQRHKWRKWIKYLYYQLKLLNKLGLKRDKGHKKALKLLDQMGEFLGQEHDFEILQTFLEQQLQTRSDLQPSLKKIIKINLKRLKQRRKQVNHLDKRFLKSL